MGNCKTISISATYPVRPILAPPLGIAQSIFPLKQGQTNIYLVWAPNDEANFVGLISAVFLKFDQVVYA